MVNKFLFFLLATLIGLTNCNNECEPTIATCTETVPNEDCHAYFERWLYNKEKNKCEFIAYSGCSQVGFEYEEDCEECKCD